MGSEMCIRDRIASIIARISSIADSSRQKVIVIGWSLGGLFARMAALRSPAQIAMVMTLGSPFSGDPHANNAWRLYQALNDHRVDNPPFEEDIAVKPAMRTIALWSPRDGIIAPECARGQAGESDHIIETDARHLELASSRSAIRAIIAALETEQACDDG